MFVLLFVRSFTRSLIGWRIVRQFARSRVGDIRMNKSTSQIDLIIGVVREPIEFRLILIDDVLIRIRHVRINRFFLREFLIEVPFPLIHFRLKRRFSRFREQRFPVGSLQPDMLLYLLERAETCTRVFLAAHLNEILRICGNRRFFRESDLGVSNRREHLLLVLGIEGRERVEHFVRENAERPPIA